MTIESNDNPFGNPVEDGGEGAISFGGLNDIVNKFHAPTGLYEFRVVESVYGPAKSSGNPMVTLKLCLTGRMMTRKGLPDFDKQDDEQSGKEMIARVALTKAAAFKVKEMADAFDLPIDDAGNIAFRARDLMHLQGVVFLADKIYEDNLSSEVKKLYRHPQGPQQ